jgi:beta-carotene hydroxylase
MNDTTPEPEALEGLLVEEAVQANASASAGIRSENVRAENLVAAKYWGGIQYRIVATFLLFTVCWVGIIVLGVNGTLPLWQCLILNSIFASTFYMPMHEATHKNIWGKASRGRWVEEAIGVLSSIPTGINFSSHRAGHMRHHAYTNDPKRDPDHFTDGRLSELPVKFYGMTMLYSLLPFFALVPPLRILLPKSLQAVFNERGGNAKEGKAQIRFWLLTTIVLIASFVFGHGIEALLLWWLPARLQLCWLMFIFAWYPHHPANETSRYRHTRVAVFRGSGLLIRGHDHHAMHHLFPRVPHYKLKALWKELAEPMVARGVRAEGRAVEATRPVVW